MKLLFINSARDWGGAEGWSAYFTTGMGGRGHDVTFVCHPNGELYRRLKDDGRVTLVPMRIRGELDPIRLWGLMRLFRRAEPDLIVTYRTRDTKLAVVANAMTGRRPLVQAHKSPFPLRDTALYRFLWTRGVDAIAVSSHRNRDLLLEHAAWLSEIPIRVIYNGVDVERFRPMPERRAEARAELEIPESAFLVSYHGRIEPRKQVDVVIEAIATIAGRAASTGAAAAPAGGAAASGARHGPVYGLVLGDGPQLETFRERVAPSGAPVRLPGFRRDVPRLLAAADAAVHLSISDTLPHSVLEAMACGLPVIVSDEPSHREQVQDGVHGLVVPARDPDAAADAILELAGDSEARERMAGAARERAVREFNRDWMVEGYERFLEEVLDRREAMTPG